MNAVLLALLAGGGAVAGAIVDRRISSLRQRAIVWCCARALILVICLLEVVSAIRTVIQGEPLFTASTTVALIAFIFGMSLIDPLRRKFLALSRHDRNRLDL